MKLSILATLLGSAAAFAPATTGRAATQVSESKVSQNQMSAVLEYSYDG